MDQDKRLIVAGTLVGLPLLAFVWKTIFPSHPLYPPGPKQHPILGNLRDFPKKKWYHTFSEWQQRYGDLIYMRLMGRDFLVINSFEDAQELFGKRGNIHSGRGQQPMANKVQGWDWNVVGAEPGPFHTAVRGIFQKGIGQQKIADYDGLIEEESRSLLDSLRNFQGDPWTLVHGSTGAIVIKITYGNNIYRSLGPELVEMNRETLHLVTSISQRFWSVNFFPWLHYLPDWLPLEFKRIGKAGTALQRKMRYWAWGETVKQYKAGIAEQSLALEYLEENEDLDTVRDGLGMMFSAGVDNTATTILVFLADMMLHPEVQKKVHEELDREIGHGDFPTFTDRDNLPYLDAVWRESRRWHAPTPIDIPHMSQEGDVYKDRYIPKNTTMFANLGFMCRDPRIFDKPEVFMPERWLPQHNPNAKSLPDVDDIIFGFGRRICPGQYLADRTGFVFIAAVLKAYNILPIHGEVVPEEYSFSDAVIQRPIGFRCKFVSRTHA